MSNTDGSVSNRGHSSDGDRGQISGFILTFFFILLATLLFFLIGVIP